MGLARLGSVSYTDITHNGMMPHRHVGVAGDLVGLLEIFREIQYCRGTLTTLSLAGKEDEAFDVQVVRFERGKLLLGVESEHEVIARGCRARLDVPTPDALYRFFTVVDRVVSGPGISDFICVFVNDFDRIQRRKQVRYAVNYSCVFIPLALKDEMGVAGSSSFERYGRGKVSDISMEGMRFETDYTLPVGMEVEFAINTVGVELNLAGRIVRTADDATGRKVYGIKFTRMETVTLRRLSRLILQFERQEKSASEKGEGSPRPGAGDGGSTSGTRYHDGRGLQRRRWR